MIYSNFLVLRYILFIMNVKELKLNKLLEANILDLKFGNLTRIQSSLIPEALNKQDILAIAQTGSGKTAAYLIPIINNLLESNDHNLTTLIIVPTRDLVNQVYDTFIALAKNTHLKAAKVMGGINQSNQIETIKEKVNVIIAVTGRLMDFINRKIILLNHIKTIVLDEVDKMLDMGFRQDIIHIFHILEKMKSKYNTIMVSATMPKQISELANKLLKDNHIKIELEEEQSIKDLINQKILLMHKSHQIPVLIETIFNNNVQTIVFVNTINEAVNIENLLRYLGLNVASIHGDRTQAYREKIINQFKQKELSILVATDVLSRGMDIKDLDLVINYNLPESLETYIHRIGRVGRAKNKGRAISIININEKEKLEKLVTNYDLKVSIIEKDEWNKPNKENLKTIINKFYNNIK